MKFDKPSGVATIVYWLREADLPRSINRSLINELFNGSQPYTDQEQRENNINTNVNFLDAPRIAHQARNTLNNAFLKPGNFFKGQRSEEHTSELQSLAYLVCRLLLEKKKKI